VPAPLFVQHHAPAEGPGTGVRYLLVHGSMDRSTSLGRVARRLNDSEVVTYDRRGYAKSLERGASLSFGDQVDDLLEVVDGHPVVALGHSFGGTVVLGAAARHPELILGAVVFEIPMPWLDWWPATTAGRAAAEDPRPPEDVAESFMRRLIGDSTWERLPATTKRARRSEGRALVSEMRGLEVPAWNPADIRIPVIVGYGTKGMSHQRRGSIELAAALPHGELVELEGATHGAHIAHPHEIVSLLRRVAAQVVPGARADSIRETT
jgi:pimeloyl-ACP methyl ester carboxylesterase